MSLFHFAPVIPDHATAELTEDDVLVLLSDAVDRLGMSSDELLAAYDDESLPDSPAGFQAAQATRLLGLIAAD